MQGSSFLGGFQFGKGVLGAVGPDTTGKGMEEGRGPEEEVKFGRGG
jgi:hypothetical protein